MHSLKDELQFLFSGKGMPYEKVSLIVAIVISVVFTVIFANNYIKDGKVSVIDLDNSKYSRELIDTMNASPFIKIQAVLNTPAEPKTLFYRDDSIAVVYLPKDLEKNRYSQSAASIGVFYDNTNSAQTAEIKAALNEIIAAENQKIALETGGVGENGIMLHDRILFNPVNSTCNGETMGFLFFFSSMFFVFATIGMIPRLKLERKFSCVLEEGNPFAVLIRLIPYGGCLLTALFVGLAVLRIGGDLVFSGSVIVFLFSQVLYCMALGMMSLLFGWTALNPGVAASRMILFIPGGFILGGLTGPIPILPEWVQAVSHVFPLVWEYHFVRDILMRGAAFMDCARIFGGFMFYLAAIYLLFCFCFYKARQKHLKEQAARQEGLVI